MTGSQSFVAGILSLGLVTAAPQVQIQAGTLHGTTCENAPTSVFRGIPFAQPPVRGLRFMPPQPMNSTYPAGELNATQFSASCIQMPGAFAWTKPSESEDCLYLDVYLPPGNHSGLPVKVWAYGGGNIGGSTSYPLYDLCNLATDSIAVAFHYRLGPFGFLGLEAAGIEGNMGIKDYVAALTWVQQNIESFGGDKHKVMLFGQSSGGDDTYVVSTLPQAKSLIHAAICESGGGVDLPPYETVQYLGANYANTANCSSSDLSCLQSKSVADLVTAYVNTPALYQGVGTFSNPNLGAWDVNLPNTTTFSLPFVDSNFIIQQPLEIGPKVPIIMGSNGEDGSLFSLPLLFLSGKPITEENYTTYLTQFGSSASKVSERFPLSMFNTSGSTEIAVATAITFIQTESAYTCFTYRGLRSAVNAGVPAFAYIFNHTESCPWLWSNGSFFPEGGEAALFGATHTAELPLVLGNLEDQPWGNGTCNASKLEYGLAKELQSMWTAMASTGNPSISDFTWPQYNECSGQGMYVLNSTAVQKLDFSECDFWDKIWQEQGGVRMSSQTCIANGTTSSNISASSTPYKGSAASTWRYTGLSSASVVLAASILLLW